MLPEFLSNLGQPSLPPQPEPFSGVHYAKTPIKGGILHGDKRGSTGEGEESDRVYLPPRGAPAAVHVYENNGQVFGKHPQILTRPHGYQVNGNYALATIEDEPKWGQVKEAAKNEAIGRNIPPEQAELIGRNEAEWALKESGYHGYKSKSTPGNVVLFGDHPAVSLDKVVNNEASIQQNSDTPVGVENSLSEETTQPSPPISKIKTSYPLNPPHMHETHPAGADPIGVE